MVTLRTFLSGVIGGFLNVFISPYIIGYLPGFPLSGFIYNALLFGVWVVVATLILERTGH